MIFDEVGKISLPSLVFGYHCPPPKPSKTINHTHVNVYAGKFGDFNKEGKNILFSFLFFKFNLNELPCLRTDFSTSLQCFS